MNVTIGPRVVKTGIAVVLALFITEWFKLDATIIASVAAIFAIQPSVYRTWRHALEQFQANTLGALLALGVSFVVPINEVVIGLTCIAVIMISLALRVEDTVALTLVTTIVVLEANGDWQYALQRFSAILIGIASAVVVNAFVMPPKSGSQFLAIYRNALEPLSLLFKTAVSDELKETEAKAQRDRLNETVNKLREWYGMHEEEWRKWRRLRTQPSRELVLQKQLLRSATAGLLVLDALEEYYYSDKENATLAPLLEETLDDLIDYHEYAVLKYEGKVKPGEQSYSRIGQRTDHLLQAALQMTTEKEAAGVSLVMIASTIHDYGRQLRRLDKMIENVKEKEAGQG